MTPSTFLTRSPFPAARALTLRAGLRISRRVGLGILTLLVLGTTARSTEAQDVAPEAGQRFRDFFLYFEPDRAALHGVRLYDSRIPDLTEEGLAARVRGYRDLRESVGGVAGLEPLHSYLGIRALAFDEIRSWARSPGFYLDPLSNSLWAIEQSPSLPRDLRVAALTERARQLPNVLKASRDGLIHPPRFLVEAALRHTQHLTVYVDQLQRDYSDMPEGAEKWALDQALASLAQALGEYETFLWDAALPGSNPRGGMGEDLLGRWGVAFGFDGVLHQSDVFREVVERSGAGFSSSLEALGWEASRIAEQAALGSRATKELSDAAVAAFRTLATNGGDEIRPSLVMNAGPSVSGARWKILLSGGVGTEMNDFPIAGYVVGSQEVSLPEFTATTAIQMAWLWSWRRSGGLRSEEPSWQALVAAETAPGGSRWFLLRRLAETDSGLVGLFASRMALEAAVTAQAALAVHRGHVTEGDAVETISREALVSLERAEDDLAQIISNPAKLFDPAIGLRLEREWESAGKPDVFDFLSEALVTLSWLKSGVPN